MLQLQLQLAFNPREQMAERPLTRFSWPKAICKQLNKDNKR